MIPIPEDFRLADEIRDWAEDGKPEIDIDISTLDQQVRIVGDPVVIANATINFKGTKNGKPFDITEQCTTIWAWRDGRWQIVFDHISFVKQ